MRSAHEPNSSQGGNEEFQSESARQSFDVDRLLRNRRRVISRHPLAPMLRPYAELFPQTIFLQSINFPCLEYMLSRCNIASPVAAPAITRQLSAPFAFLNSGNALLPATWVPFACRPSPGSTLLENLLHHRCRPSPAMQQRCSTQHCRAALQQAAATQGVNHIRTPLAVCSAGHFPVQTDVGNVSITPITTYTSGPSRLRPYYRYG